jgi:hypothetical protein
MSASKAAGATMTARGVQSVVDEQAPKVAAGRAAAGKVKPSRFTIVQDDAYLQAARAPEPAAPEAAAVTEKPRAGIGTGAPVPAAGAEKPRSAVRTGAPAAGRLTDAQWRQSLPGFASARGAGPMNLTGAERARIFADRRAVREAKKKAGAARVEQARAERERILAERQAAADARKKAAAAKAGYLKTNRQLERDEE